MLIYSLPFCRHVCYLSLIPKFSSRDQSAHRVTLAPRGGRLYTRYTSTRPKSNFFPLRPIKPIPARRNMPLPQKKAAGKESVIYPASKRKPPPFKPQRPGKYAAVAASRRDASMISQDANARMRRENANTHSESNEDEDEDEDDEDDLDDDPLATKPRRTVLPGKKKMPSRSTAPGPSSPHSRESSHQHSPLLLPPPPSSPPSLSSPLNAPQIPTPLLLRLLHENFASPTTQITVPALEVVRAYIDVFVREAIARTALSKRERPGVAEDDKGWLELEDLERVVVGVVMDF